MNTYQLLLDIWEADTKVDVAQLKDAGVNGMIVRLNDMNGGHHLDANFVTNWNKAQQFPASMIYFVYNPWVSGQVNYRWCKAHLPSDFGGRRLMSDIEVKYKGYSASAYAAEVEDYTGETQVDHPRHSIYTGGWFKPILAYWPKTSYWWGRYPYIFYPKDRVEVTWAHLRSLLVGATYSPDPSRQSPGPVEMWQFTADRLILPGFGGRACDLNVFPGTLEELINWSGGSGLPPVPELTLEEKVNILWQQHLAQQ